MIFRGGGQLDKLNGDGGSDFLFGDFGVVRFASNAPNGSLFGMLSIDSLNCTTNGGGRNNINGSSGNGKSCPLLRNAFGNGPITRIAQQTSDILIGRGGSTN